MKNNWLYKELGEICKVIMGQSPPSAYYNIEKNGLPFYQGKAEFGDIYPTAKKWCNKPLKIAEKDDILISVRAPVGPVNICNETSCIGRGLAAIRYPFKDAYKFIFYYLKSIESQIIKIGTGSTFSAISKSQIENLTIPLPPLAEQKRIVAKIEELFTRLDAGVEALKKVKAQIRHYRQAVLKYAFEGKLTEKWRRNNPSSVQSRENSEKLGKDEILLSAQNDKGAYNENLSELPEGWRWVKLGEVAGKIHYGYTAKAVTQPVGPKFLRITDIQYGSVNWDTVPYCEINQKEKQKYLLKEGDLVFARTGATVGKSFLIRGKVPEAVFASYLIRINLRKGIDKRFVFNFFQSQFYWTQIHKGKIGIGQPNVNAQTLAQIIIPLPPLPEQHQIVEEIERRFSVIEQVEKIVDQSLKQAERLRQSILKRAFEGKLVPQDPNDEPVEKLLERIKQQREQSDKMRTSKRKRRK